MAARPGIRSFVALLLLLAPIPPAAAQEAGKRELLAALVADLGYGGAIHHFSDYLLRGDPLHRDAALRRISAAKRRIEALRALDGEAGQRQALDLLERTLTAYQSALAIVERLHRSHRGPAGALVAAGERIHIDDTMAVEALARLRQGIRWKRIERLRFALGYGGAIHHYKNYLIRRDDTHRQQAERYLKEALQLAAELRWIERNRPARLAAVERIEAVLEEYLVSLPVVERTLAPALGAGSEITVGIAVRGADRALKVDDGPAIEALNLLER